jgi:hypothetical protein
MRFCLFSLSFVFLPVSALAQQVVLNPPRLTELAARKLANERTDFFQLIKKLPDDSSRIALARAFGYEVRPCLLDQKIVLLRKENCAEKKELDGAEVPEQSQRSRLVTHLDPVHVYSYSFDSTGNVSFHARVRPVFPLCTENHTYLDFNEEGSEDFCITRYHCLSYSPIAHSVGTSSINTVGGLVDGCRLNRFQNDTPTSFLFMRRPVQLLADLFESTLFSVDFYCGTESGALYFFKEERASDDFSEKHWRESKVPLVQGEKIYDLSLAPDKQSLCILTATRLWRYDLVHDTQTELMRIPKIPLSGDNKSSVSEKDAETEEPITASEVIHACTVSPDGKYVLLGGMQGTVLLAESAGAHCYLIDQIDCEVADLHWMNDNRIIIVGRNGSFKSYNLTISELLSKV